MIIVQITDLHVRPPGTYAYGRVPTNDMLSSTIRQINAMQPKPDVILATGDLVHMGMVEEYGVLHDLLSELKAPVYLVPGNHDQRANLASVFSDHDYLPKQGFQQYVVEDFPVRLIALDTLIEGKGGGTLCAERLAFLEAALTAGRGKPTVIFMHHPPFRTMIDHMDVIGLDAAEALGEIVARHPEVERILCGHLHRPIQLRWRGTLASTAPSTAHQVVLDLRPNAVGAFALEPPGFQVHAWAPETGIVSHCVTIGRFDGPHPFVEPMERASAATS